MNDYDKIPPATIRTLQDYLTKGWEPGDFVRAVLENDLKMAFSCADQHNAWAMREIVFYVVNEIPEISWGSREIVDDWIKRTRQAMRAEPESDQ